MGTFSYDDRGVVVDARTRPVTVTTLDAVDLHGGEVATVSRRGVGVVDQTEADLPAGVFVPAQTRTGRGRVVVIAAGVPAGLAGMFGVGFGLGHAGVGVELLTRVAGTAAAVLLILAVVTALVLAAGRRCEGLHCGGCDQ